ncbi:MAG: hypothetical protein RLY93_18670 [Sumerlaeia bacterium]
MSSHRSASRLCIAVSVIALASAAFLSAGCGGKGDSASADLKDKPARPANLPSTANGQAIAGFNEPRQYTKGIGIRAAAQGPLLVISLVNRSQETLIVGPEQFRLLESNRGTYAFSDRRDDLSGFQIRSLEPGAKDFVTVRVPGRQLAGMPLIFNYPPMELLMRVPVERAISGTSLDLDAIEGPLEIQR